MACCVKSYFFQENDCVIYWPLFLLFAARGSVEDSAAPSSSGIFLHINFCNYKSFISENIHPPPPLLPPFFVWTCLPSPSSSFYSDFPLKNSLSLFSGNTVLFALLPEIIEYKKITNFSLSRCHYFLSFDLTKWTCYSVLWIFKWWLRNHDPFFA